MASGSFKLEKWYLDFVQENGTVMIFYAAKLRWKGVLVPFTRCLIYDPKTGINETSRFREISMPQVSGEKISWEDYGFGIEGYWESQSSSISEKFFDASEGVLQWICHQPASKVKLKVNNEEMVGRGYAEQLFLTALPWQIPMDELRWGRFHSMQWNLVWVEIREQVCSQWVWLNGEMLNNCEITDQFISCPERSLFLTLDPIMELEKGKTIHNVMQSVSRIIPGFKKAMMMKFLMADSFKWFSQGSIELKGVVSEGTAIHELVTFKSIPK